MKKTLNDEKADAIKHQAENRNSLPLSLNLKNLMVLANISEHKLSVKTKVKQPVIHRILSGENKNPTLSTLKPLADYFMITVSQLIGEELIGIQGEKTSIPILNIISNKKLTLNLSIEKGLFAIKVDDSSMEPAFPLDSFAIIDPDLEPMSNDFVAVRYPDNSTHIRQYLLISHQPYIGAINKKFGDIIKISKSYNILGIVTRTIFDHKNVL